MRQLIALVIASALCVAVVISTEVTAMTIFFIAIGDQKQLSQVARCAVRTACQFNPSNPIEVISRFHLEEPMLRITCSKLLFVESSVESILSNTPLLAWYQHASQDPRKFFNADVSDAIRTALMYTRGGVYFDLDMISLRPLDSLPVNSLGQQLDKLDRKGKVPFINGAAMIFEKHNPFMQRVMSKFASAHQPKKFGSVGPDLLWSVFRQMINESEDSASGTSLSKAPLVILPKAVFYPIKFRAGPLKHHFSKEASRLPWFPPETRDCRSPSLESAHDQDERASSEQGRAAGVSLQRQLVCDFHGESVQPPYFIHFLSLLCQNHVD